MSKEDQDPIIGRLARERKEARQQIAGLEDKLKQIGEILTAWGNKLKPPFNAAGNRKHPDDRKELETAVSEMGGLIDSFSQAKEKEAELTSELQKQGGE